MKRLERSFDNAESQLSLNGSLHFAKTTDIRFYRSFQFTIIMSLEPTLRKIKDSGTITIGHRDSSIPFSYLAGIPQPIGYSHDVALAVVESLKKKLGVDLNVRFALVTSQTRIPLVQNGTVDLECGTTTKNEEREQQVSFSSGIFETSVRMLTKANAGPPAYSDFSDLSGKNVVTTAGSTSERLVKAMNADKMMRMNVISAKDHGEAFKMLESGRAQAMILDEVLLIGQLAKARKPSDWVVTGSPQAYETYALMLRRGDDEFLAAVNEAIEDFAKSGGAERSYGKWFTQPIPPKGYNLSLELNDELKRYFSRN